MRKDSVVHKAGKAHKVPHAFGAIETVHNPYCMKKSAYWAASGRRYTTHRLWKYVTCQHCLNKMAREIARALPGSTNEG